LSRLPLRHAPDFTAIPKVGERFRARCNNEPLVWFDLQIRLAVENRWKSCDFSGLTASAERYSFIKFVYTSFEDA
jgi:hypothetical protein